MKNAPTTYQAIRGASQTIPSQVNTATNKSYSLRGTINNKCRACIYCPISDVGSWQMQTAACTSKNCPLWPVRPMPCRTTGQQLNALEAGTLGNNDHDSDHAEVTP